MTKKVYFVRMPIAGIVSTYVVAESETKNDWELETIDIFKKLIEENVDYTPLSEADDDECLMSLDSIIENVEKVMNILEASQ